MSTTTDDAIGAGYYEDAAREATYEAREKVLIKLAKVKRLVKQQIRYDDRFVTAWHRADEAIELAFRLVDNVARDCD